VLETLAVEAEHYGVRLSGEQMGQFERYLRLIADWSTRINLVSDASPEVVIRRHVLESIALGATLREREVLRPGARVLDVGAGAGFPGAVLKIAWPAIALTLLEATAKKGAFLQALVEEAPLTDTTVVIGRAETRGHDPALRERFDLVVARAVAPVRTLAELSLPFARVGGRVVSPKGSRAAAEVAEADRALRMLGGRALTVPFRVPGPPQTLVVLVKESGTPDLYPRRAGVPARSPL
jgi:16S rRNA (guanine527-N7)-methyltransferase